MLSYGKTTEKLWALSQENVHNSFPWKESDTRISPSSILIFVSKQLKAGSGILWRIPCFTISHCEFHVGKFTSWKGTLGRIQFYSHLPLHKIFQIFMLAVWRKVIEQKNEASLYHSSMALSQTNLYFTVTHLIVNTCILVSSHITGHKAIQKSLSWSKEISNFPSPGCQLSIQVLGVPCLSTPQRLM